MVEFAFVEIDKPVSEVGASARSELDINPCFLDRVTDLLLFGEELIKLRRLLTGQLPRGAGEHLHLQPDILLFLLLSILNELLLLGLLFLLLLLFLDLLLGAMELDPGPELRVVLDLEPFLLQILGDGL